MMTNRKADLQRKLAMAPVPKPPAGLADRIKSDIPKHLLIDADKERARLRQGVAFNVRVAASIILLVSSVYLTLHLMSRSFGPEEFPTAARNAPATATPVTATVKPDLAAARTPEPARAAEPASPPPGAKERLDDRKRVIVAEARQEALITRAKTEKKDEQDVEGGVAQGVVGGITADAAAPMVAKAAAAPSSQPAAARENSWSDALVQRFARNVAVPAKETLDVEASAAPFDAARQIVRVSLDGPHEAKPEVVFNDRAVASWRVITSDGTSLYEIALTGEDDVIATVRLHAVERTIRRGDLRAWNDASRRMKSASLAAALATGTSPREVAAKARAAGLDELAAAAEARVPR